jgi:RimJ/RimL family protein N-acetyltransferase
MSTNQGVPIFSCVCEEKSKHDKEMHVIERHVYNMDFTPENVKRLWEEASKFPFLFWERLDSFKNFIELIISKNGDRLDANGLFWVIDDFVGVFYMTNINLAQSDAQIHYSFFDKRHNGRKWLTRQMIRYVFEKFKLHRLTAEIPKFNQGPFEFIKNVGLTREGVKRQACRYNEQWYDVEIWSILNEETNAWAPSPIEVIV